MFCGFVHEFHRIEISQPHERWLLDSGASKHMTNDIKMVQDLVTLNDSVKIRDGSTLKVTHKGRVVLQKDKKHKMQVSNVLMFP